MEFQSVRHLLENQYTDIAWVPGSGLDSQALAQQLEVIADSYPSAALIRAHCFAFIAENARLAIDKADIFQEKLDGVNLIRRLRIRWEKQLKQARLAEQAALIDDAWSRYGTFKANSDYSHTSPNSRLLLQVGFAGLRDRVQAAAAREGLSQKQAEFYQSCDIMLTACCTAARRLAEAVAPYSRENAEALMQLSQGAPRSTYEALQLLVLYFYLHDYIFGTRIRTLGRLDVLLTGFVDRDLESGACTEAQLQEQLKFFLHKFWSAKVPYDLPFCLCGMDRQGNEVTNHVTRTILRCYNELNIYSPKIHIRISPKTPADVVKQVMGYIRSGNSSFVFIHDRTAIRGLTQVGICEEDARDFVPIGCYEPAVWGMELGCTGCGGINLPKAVELVFQNGRDNATGELCGLQTGPIESYEAFLAAVKQQLAHQTRLATDYVTAIEPYYGTVNPDPLLSSQYEACLEAGVDVYDGGAKYNNSSMSFYCLGSLTDCICAVKRLVFEEKRFTFPQLGQILAANWEGHEQDRRYALQLPEKFGNNDPTADAVAAEFAHFCADLVNNKPNGRGGVYKAALYTIDHCFIVGGKTMATPDGRKAGQPLSKNLCAVTGMDRKGITAMIQSAGKIDASRFPNGSVLDVVLHPSAVAGQEGLDAFYGLVMTYFRLGGLALHGNVFNPRLLRQAQADPDSYRNLQVRVCGWNAYFVNLKKEEQDAFILQAENAM